MKLPALLAIIVLATTACDHKNDGYYWWDETNKVWCFTYKDGHTVCDTPVSDGETRCQANDDGTRHCEVVDGSYVCTFDYDSSGAMTPGICVYVGSPANTTNRDCSPASDGSLICQFDNTDGSHCVVVFDKTGVATYDPCGYFVTGP